MTENTSTIQASQTHWRDYYNLCKPKVVYLMLLTAFVGMLLASPGSLPFQAAALGLLGIGLMAGGAAAFNHVLDRRIDERMARTHHRPLPKGRLSVTQAVSFACLITSLGFYVLWAGVNALTAGLTFVALVGYAVVYTLWLKRATPQNIVIGGLAGAAPPLLGWTAITGALHPHALLLVMIIFTWTPPHFWALAIHRRDDYAKVGIPMLPVTHGIEFTKTMVLLYTLLQVLVGWLPFVVGMTGWIYLVGATVLNLGFVWMAVQLKFGRQQEIAWKTFKFSITHLMILFVVLLVDHWWKI